MIAFVLFPGVSEPSMNFNLSKLVYYRTGKGLDDNN